MIKFISSLLVWCFLLGAIAEANPQTFTEVPRTSDSIVDSIGLNTRCSLSTKGWYDCLNPNASRAALDNLGIRHIRDTVSNTWDDQSNELVADNIQWYQQLGADGIKISTILPAEYGFHPAYVSEMLSLFPNIEAFQLGNENEDDHYSLCPGSDTIYCWPENTQSLINYYAPQIKAANRLVEGPAFIAASVCYHTPGVQAVTLTVKDCPIDGTNDMKVMGQEPQVDFAALQYYPNGRIMSQAGFPTWLADSKYFSTKGTLITEAGYGTGQDAYYSGDPGGMTDTHISELTTREFLEPLVEGYRGTFGYQLLNQTNLSAGSYFGSMGYLTVDPNTLTETPKIQYFTLRNMLALFNNPGPFATVPITFTLNATSDVHHIMTQRNDGTYLLALWREAQDPVAHETVNLSVQSPLIVWCQTETFTPSNGSFVNTQYPSNQKSYNIPVGPELTIVRLNRYWKPMPPPLPNVGPFYYSTPSYSRTSLRKK